MILTKKNSGLFLLICWLSSACWINSKAQEVEMVISFSQNGEYWLKSIPFDDFGATGFGKTYVYKTRDSLLMYTIDKYFNCRAYADYLQLSNDGKSFFYLDKELLDNHPEKSVLVFYNNGIAGKAYTLNQLVSCNSDTEDCTLLYQNPRAFTLSNRIDSNNRLKLIPIEKVSEEEAFACRHNLFSMNDTLYMVDQNRRLHTFNLHSGELMSTVPYKGKYSFLNKRLYLTQTISTDIDSFPSPYHLPPLPGGRPVANALADELGMLLVKNDWGDTARDFKLYKIHVEGLVDNTGKLTILQLEVDQKLDGGRVRQFFESNQYDRAGIFAPFEKWMFREYFHLMNKSAEIARKEKIAENQEWQETFMKRSAADSINGDYIPKNLEDCFYELDRLLRTKDKNQIRDATPEELGEYHMGLGLYLRNKWHLWGGSRLTKYFDDHGRIHPDNMSSIIIQYYQLWLKGDKNAWKQWEEEHPIEE